jgi:hypothetical protein
MAFFFLSNEALDNITLNTTQKTVMSGTLKLGLFVSNLTLALSDVMATFTAVEATVSGYSPISLTTSSWSGSTSGGVSLYTYPTVTWTFTANTAVQTVYGVFFYSDNGMVKKLVGAKKLASSYLVPPGGGSLNFDLSWSNISQ